MATKVGGELLIILCFPQIDVIHLVIRSKFDKEIQTKKFSLDVALRQHSYFCPYLIMRLVY